MPDREVKIDSLDAKVHLALHPRKAVRGAFELCPDDWEIQDENGKSLGYCIRGKDAATESDALECMLNATIWGEQVFRGIPFYTTDMAAAWSLVEKMREAGFRVETICWAKGDTPEHCVTARQFEHPFKEFNTEALTMPEAIIAAFLQWKAVECGA